MWLNNSIAFNTVLLNATGGNMLLLPVQHHLSNIQCAGQ